MIFDVQLLSGEMHYARVPRAYWRARLEMAYAMGLDAVSTYVFWNLHEPSPGVYDFAGENDVAEYVREAARTGLGVLLRPGPYVCAEWDFGGLPAWLLAGGDTGIRTAGEGYMEPVRRWLRRLGQELAPLQRAHGGPILAVQLENEYGAFGSDDVYLCALRAALDAAGFAQSPYYTIDQPRDLARGSLPGVPIAATFGPGDPERELAALQVLRPGAPPACGEYWAGWFDHWGEPHQRSDDAGQARDYEWMLQRGCSVNIYMFHGGTNFGFTNGANAADEHPYQPDATSYDYLAALDEAGRPRPKYFAFRDAIARRNGRPLRPVPPAPQTMAVAEFALDESASLEPLLQAPAASDAPQAMEALGQSFGYICYRGTLPTEGPGLLEIDELRDYAVVSIDGRVAGHLDRRLGESAMRLTARRGAVLDILVENGGRINYGPALTHERKGITRTVRWNGEALRGWKIFALPFDDLRALRFSARRTPAPAFRRGRFELAAPGDTFLDLRGLGKGVLWVNGHHAGRFWKIGPQRSLYVPGAWMRRGANEVVAFDLFESFQPRICGACDPVIE